MFDNLWHLEKKFVELDSDSNSETESKMMRKIPKKSISYHLLTYRPN